jgi:hypothetical protein
LAFLKEGNITVNGLFDILNKTEVFPDDHNACFRLKN